MKYLSSIFLSSLLLLLTFSGAASAQNEIERERISLIREAAAELVEEFIQDYRLANSRR